MSPNTLVGSHIDGPPVANGQASAPMAGTASQPLPAMSSNLQATSADEVHDLICVGFGPASLAVAVAIHDGLESGAIQKSQAPKVLFLEKQQRFAWHAGMLLPGAKMQISFIKDMATLRDPRSHFTFLNFVHEKRRLIDFINLNTFLPARVEYEEYLRWCADHFRHVVQYGREVHSVTPVRSSSGGGGPVSVFEVTSVNAQTGHATAYRAKNVIMAYAHLVPKILRQSGAPYRVAVIGGGQSGAEIFNNIQKLYPNSKTHLIMRSEFLKPSDDSPFVNSIFNPSFIDDLYPRSASSRSALLQDARGTNYGVVRLELIEALYEHMYEQRREFGPDERAWPHRIHGATEVTGLDGKSNNSDGPLRLRVRSLRDHANASVASGEEAVLDVDLVIAATGYQRTSHLKMMEKVAPLLPGHHQPGDKLTDRDVKVGRDYGVEFAPGKVAKGSGIWLQGCNEKTHGLSDTLLSVLATRSGEIVESIFGDGSKGDMVKSKL
ncbi:l-lysine 6-monooxygenase (NADPH-requiring) domain-containing protein [Apiospora hydei]|uniref:L-ornithine N(5)-monooxygenase [NAD(P)H] n=1 Tax=Apiospora hydei TaxID=1337664 RepID=A0ABR1WL25_9PEZI